MCITQLIYICTITLSPPPPPPPPPPLSSRYMKENWKMLLVTSQMLPRHFLSIVEKGFVIQMILKVKLWDILKELLKYIHYLMMALQNLQRCSVTFRHQNL